MVVVLAVTVSLSGVGAAQESTGPDLLTNSGCDQDGGGSPPDGWTLVSTNVQCANPEPSGPAAPDGSDTFIDFSDDASDAIVQQEVDVTGGVSYEVGGEAGVGSDTTDFARIEVEYYDSSGTRLSGTGISREVRPTSGVYESFTTATEAPAAADTAVVRIKLVDTDGGYSDAYVNQVSFRKVNTAPTLSTDARSLDIIDEDDTDNAGTAVSTVLDSAGTASDADGDTLGVAVTGVDDTDGTWEYSTDSGSTWQTVASASPADDSSLLLAAADRLRFVPDTNFNGDAGGSVTFRAWDETSGSAGDTAADTTTTGGATAFSTDTASAGIMVTAVNDAPSITIGNDQSVGATTSEQTVVDFATGFDPVEDGQSIEDFDVTNDNTGLFTVQPDIDNSGDLTYTPADDVSGTATVSVQVIDDGGDGNGGEDTSTTQTFVVTVDNTAPEFGNSDTAAIDEETTGTVLDVEAGDDGTASPDTSVDYTLGGPDAAAFSIDSSTGQITLDSPQDFENPSDDDGNGDYELTVTAQDDAGNTGTQSITVSITDVNEAPAQPSDSDGAADEVAESAANGATVGIDADATDPEGDGLTWSLTDDAGGRFGIDTSGVVTVADTTQLDFESTSSHDITVSVSDGPLSATSDFTITVTDSDETPSFTSGTAASVAETATDGTTVSDVNANVGGSDDEGVDYAITSGNSDGAYAIDGSGQITVSDDSHIDYESSTERTVTVTASEGSASETQDITISVTDVDESPTFTSGTSDTIAEDASNGDTVHDVHADVGGSSDEAVSYQFTGGNGAGAFSIDGSTGQIDVADATQFDHEGTNSFSLTVEASEGTATNTRIVSISVTDVDETPSFTSGTEASVSEATTDGTTVLDVDANVGGTTDTGVGYAIASGNGDSAYAIDASGLITVSDASEIDYERSTSRTLTVEASEGTQSETQDITISVTDSDESPTFTSGMSDTIAEDAANGDPVHDVDANVGGDNDEALSYTITAGNGAGAFTIDGSTGQIGVADNTQFNYEGTNSFSLTVEVSEGAATNTRTVSISVTDVNDAPTDIGLSSAAVAQSGGTNAVVGRLSITDEDDTTGTYNLASGAGDDNNSAFAIASGDLVATDAASLDEGDYDVRIEADDGSSGTIEKAFTVAVTDDVSPTLVASTPADDATGVDDDTNITVSFSEPVAFDSGTLRLREADSEGNFTDAETFDVESDIGRANGNVSVSGATVTINPSGDLSRRTTYAVRIDAGALADTAATPNEFGGIADDTTLNFTVEAPRSRGGGGGGGGDDSPPEPTEPTVVVDSTAESERDRSNVTVSDAEAGTPVTISFEAESDTTDGIDSGETQDGAARNVSLSQLAINTTTGGDFTLNVTTAETRSMAGTGAQTETNGNSQYQNELAGLDGDERAFALATGARSVGTVIVDHSVPDEDIEDVAFSFRVRKTYLDSVGVTADSVALYRDESTRWNQLSTTVVAETETAYVFSATSPGLSTFRMGSSVPLFEVTDARVSQSSIEPGGAVDVTVTVANRGGANGTYDAVLRANGETITTNAVEIPAGGEQTVTLTNAFTTNGDYALAIGNTSAGTVSVITPQITEFPTDSITESPTESPTGTPADESNDFPFSVILLLLAIAVVAGGVLVWSRRQDWE